MFMSRRRTLFALCAVALSAVLLLPDVSSAQRFGGRGGRAFGGIGNYGGYGGYGGGYGGYGNYGWGNTYGGWGTPYNYGGNYGGYGWSQPGYTSQPYYGGTWGGNY